MNERQKRIRQVISEAKEFASDYGIVENDLMTHVVSQKDVSYWGVYASPKDEIKRVIGKFGNETWSSWQDAKARSCELESKGFETYLRIFPAFSNEDCQITYSVLNSSDTYASYLVFHESFHIQSKRKKFGLKGNSLEENFAESFAYYLQMKFFASQPEKLDKMEKWHKEWIQYYSLLKEYHDRMKSTLVSSPSKKEKIHAEIIADARKNARRFSSSTIKNRLTKDTFNNAHLLQASYYFDNSGEIEKQLKKIDPHEYIHSRQDLQRLLTRLNIPLV